MTLTPAYGRMYKTAHQIKQDFIDGKDFILNDISSPYNGKYCSIRDFSKNQLIQLRYKNNTRVTTIKVP